MALNEIFNFQRITANLVIRSEFLLYKIAIYATINLIDDAAMLAMIFT